MEPNSTWSWLWQNFLSDALWWVFVAVVAVVIAVLKRKRSDWLSPVLYGLIGMGLFGAILYSSRIYARWPLAAPIILVSVLLAAAGLHLAAVFVERRSLAKGEPVKTDHSACERKISNLEGQIYRLDKENVTRGLQISARESDIEALRVEKKDALETIGGLKHEEQALNDRLNELTPPRGRLKIKRAEYHLLGKVGLDVAEKVDQMILDDKLVLNRRYKDMFSPDPMRGALKHLTVEFLHGPRQFTVTIPEDTVLTLPFPYKDLE